MRCGLALLLSAAVIYADSNPTRYLSLQIFTSRYESPELARSFPPAPRDLRQTIVALRDRIGLPTAGDRRLGVVLGPIAFDQTDEEVSAMIAGAFDIALETGVAIGLHLDDQMFWGRAKELARPGNLEWLDWNGTPNTGRRLDWSEKPMKVMPQLCLNSPTVQDAVRKRAALIGSQIAAGVKRLQAAGKSDLFVGVIAGWESQIGPDFDTGKPLGYCALTNAGFGAKNSAAELDAARTRIVGEFAGLWARELVHAGVPRGKVYSHVAYPAEKPAVAFCEGCVPGFSTYPGSEQLEQSYQELARRGNPPWASCEGTALDPAQAWHSGKPLEMESYLASLFNHGAILVNVFGWGVGNPDNPFRTTAESDEAVAAYRKFLRGETLHEVSTLTLPDKLHLIQAKLPWVAEHGDAQLKDEIKKMTDAVREKRYAEVERIADDILRALPK